MPVTASRAVLRQSQFLTRRTAVRYASNTSEAASKASQTASSAASKASEGLSRVTSTAGPAISNAAQGLGSALRKVGGRTGKVIAFVDCKHHPFPFSPCFVLFVDDGMTGVSA
jgi:F-type H+-transporting ATPase subunit g